MDEITSQVDCGHYRCYGACGYQPPVKPQAPTADELLDEVKRQAAQIERLKADLSRERAAHEETRLARNRARLDGIAEARKNLPPEIARLKIEAAWYRLLRRGQHWSVIDGVGQTLRGEELDAAVAAVKGET